MRLRWWWLLAPVVAAYTAIFFQVEATHHSTTPKLTPTMSPKLQRAAWGYMHQLGAEMLYIKAAVFLGGRAPETKSESYAPTLSEHFDVMSRLHPKLIDTYYLCESSLSWISPDNTRFVNRILDRGIQARPKQWMLPFFEGFNYWRYLNEPKRAASSLWRAVDTHVAPGWVGQLATILAAENGDIYGGMVWLQAMLEKETDPAIRSRYKADLAEFRKAAQVLQAVKRYQKVYGHKPARLHDLVPEFLPALPVMSEGYILSYKEQHLHLQRKKKKGPDSPRSS